MKGVSTVYDYNYRAWKAGAKGTFTEDEWRCLCDMYDNRCIACGRKQLLSPDHILPISKGGANYIDNIQPLCQSCNSSKKELHIDFRTCPFPGIGWQTSYMKGYSKK